MVMEKPYDLAVMFGLFALVILTVGFAVTDINTFTNTTHETTFFDSVASRVNTSTGLKGTADSSASGLTGEVGSSEEATEESFLLKGFQSLLNLGQTWALVENSLDEAVETLGINPVYIIIITSILVIAFAVTTYTWLRGR